MSGAGDVSTSPQRGRQAGRAALARSSLACSSMALVALSNWRSVVMHVLGLCWARLCGVAMRVKIGGRCRPRLQRGLHVNCFCAIGRD